jgi:hypothetical protein
VIPLLNLEKLTIEDLPAHSIFLDHLSIPTGASLNLGFSFSYDSPSIPVCLANDFKNLSSYHHNQHKCERTTGARACNSTGPSGELRTRGRRNTSSLFLSLSKFDLSKTRRLSVTAYHNAPRDEFPESPIFQTLLLMKNLRTLTLLEIDIIPFINALNPKQNKTRTVACSELEELILYIRRRDQTLPLDELKNMASERAQRSSKLPSITIISLGIAFPKEAVFSLRNYVSRVEYKLETGSPKWDVAFDDEDDGGYESDWEIFRYDDGGSDDTETEDSY